MRLISVELENIKSYRRATIPLAEGVNAICGLNGSGKTTLLEAIGFALFDSLPYNQGAFLREGEKTGTVRVRLLAHDERVYEIVRKVGSGAGHYVADVESGTRIAERNETLTWIREHALRMEGEADLRALFENAVGVPQGTMTAVFLQPANPRKNIFDPLLRVEEYRGAFDRLLETVNHLKDRIGMLNAEIARLEGETARIADLEAELETLGHDLQAVNADLETLADRRNVAEMRVRAFDEAEKRVADLAGRVKTATMLVEERERSRQQQERLANEAREAREVVLATELAYRQVVAARKELARLQEQLAIRERIEKDMAGVSTAVTKTNDIINETDAEWRTAVAAGERAVALEPQVIRWQELDERKRVIEDQQRELVRIEKELGERRQELEGACRDAEMRSRAIAEARAAAERAAALPARRERLDQLRRDESDLQTVAGRRSDREKEGKDLRKRFDALDQDRKRLAEIRAEMAALQPLVAGTPALAERERTLRERQVEINATRQYLGVAVTSLQRGQCPILDLACPAVAANATVIDRVSPGDLLDELNDVARDLAEIQADLNQGQQAVARYQTLQGSIEPLERSERDITDLEAELERVRAEYAELSDHLKRKPEIERDITALLSEIRGLEADQQQAAAIESLLAQETRDDERRTALTKRIDELESSRAPLLTLAADLQVVTQELQSLGNPAQERNTLLAQANRAPQLEIRLQRLQEQLQQDSDRLRALIAERQPFASLDEAMAAEQDVLERLSPEHDRYLQHKNTAAEVETRETAEREAERSLTDAQSDLEQALADHANAAEGYDATAHREARDDLEEVRGEESTLLERRKNIAADVEERLAILDALRVKEKKLHQRLRERLEMEETLTTVDFVRKTIKEAGPIVTKTLLGQISAGANDFFAELMDDHAAELRWEDNYEIVVQRGTEVRKFAQLSGGEQMSAALSIRLALLREISGIDVAFFDEPTQNMDEERRSSLADQINQVRGFEQLIVISHDDAFEHQTDHLIRLHKDHDETIVEVG